MKSMVRSGLWFAAGIFVVVGCFEAIVANQFSLPANAQEPDGALQRFFNYGLSTQAKLDRSVGNADQKPTDIVRAGWISTELYPPSAKWKAADQRVVFYGMSFTNRIARELGQLDSSIGISTRAGPGAPLSHSMALFEADPWRTQADVVIVGILSSSIPYMQGFTGLGYTPENPAPYTFPMYMLVNKELNRYDPPIMRRDQFVEAYRNDSSLWKKHLAAIISHDAYWSSFVFSRSFMDRSAMVRLIRRAWASRKIDQVARMAYDQNNGYAINNPSVAAIPEILNQMQAECDVSGQKLVVILLHARNEPGDLHAWLFDKMVNKGIAMISTTDLFSSTDQQNFESSGHYLPKNDKLIASSVLKLLRKLEDEK